jgi:hypothetical protein
METSMNTKEELQRLVEMALYYAGSVEREVAELARVQDKIEKLRPGWTIKLATNLAKVQAQLVEKLDSEFKRSFWRRAS